jgi:Ni/Co efflux regulator RcnB
MKKLLAGILLVLCFAAPVALQAQAVAAAHHHNHHHHRHHHRRA